MIHEDNPFLDPPAERDPVRRFRGRLAAPVTIVTAGRGDTTTGLTVSSLMVLEGEPPGIRLVVGPTSDLWGVVAETGRFVVHVCRDGDRHIAESFAGLRPSPGGLFADVQSTSSEFGPVITSLADRAYCSLEARSEAGYTGLVTGTIDRLEMEDLDSPLVYFRGRYRSLR